MAYDINVFKTLSESEQRTEIDKIEGAHREARKHLENVEKMCKAHFADEKTSAKEAAAIIDHLNEVKQMVKNLDEDMARIGAFMYGYNYGETTSNNGGCGENDPYVALNSIVGNGVSHIRPEELCQRPMPGAKTYKDILDDRRKGKEAQERKRWVSHQGEVNRPTKKEEPSRKEEFSEKREEHKEKELKEKEQKVKGAQ